MPPSSSSPFKQAPASAFEFKKNERDCVHAKRADAPAIEISRNTPAFKTTTSTPKIPFPILHQHTARRVNTPLPWRHSPSVHTPIIASIKEAKTVYLCPSLQENQASVSKNVRKKQTPSASRKSTMLVIISLLLSGGLVAGAMSNPTANKTDTPLSLEKTVQQSNKITEPLVFNTPRNKQPANNSPKNTSPTVFVPNETTTLNAPPPSAIDDTLSFEQPITPPPVALPEKPVRSPKAFGVSPTAHVVDLFEDASPIVSLSLPKQKKRTAIETVLLQTSNSNDVATASHPTKHWWQPTRKTTFNFRRPLMHLRVSSHFGHRWGRMHQGVDFSAPYGVSIYAANTGTVVYSGWEQGYGNLVILDHGNGVRTKYAHCSKLTVSVGELIQKGERIAKVGSTGHSTGPHLHFEIVVDGKSKNPLNYLTT
jgi:murein DD-endopeptidase MepM/ murein hydrolase activator NlpD